MFLNCEGGSENWKVVRGELRQGCPLCGVSHSSREDCEVRGSRLLSLLVGRGGILVGLSLFIRPTRSETKWEVYCCYHLVHRTP